jgi:hypothetical protein
MVLPIGQKAFTNIVCATENFDHLSHVNYFTEFNIVHPDWFSPLSLKVEYYFDEDFESREIVSWTIKDDCGVIEDKKVIAECLIDCELGGLAISFLLNTFKL